MQKISPARSGTALITPYTSVIHGCSATSHRELKRRGTWLFHGTETACAAGCPDSEIDYDEELLSSSQLLRGPAQSKEEGVDSENRDQHRPPISKGRDV